MISVAEALDHLFALAAPLEVETVPLAKANGRVLAQDVTAKRNQPPFAGSAMDGYAVRNADVATGATLQVRDVTNSVWEGFECPQPVIKIKGCFPLVIKWSEQNTHTAAKQHRRLADETVGTKALNAH